MSGSLNKELLNEGGYVNLNDFSLAMSVDCVVFGYEDESKDLKILLIKSETKEYKGQWSLLGDLVHPKENLNSAANRVLDKRTGLTDVYLEQVEVFSDPKRHPRGRVVTVAYYSLIKIKDYELNVEKLDLEARWIPIKEVGKLAFDHNEILSTCLEKLQKGLREKPIGFSLLPKKFSLKQLQNLYETILSFDFDRRNFRRKLKSLDVLLELNETQQDVAHRPAKLYVFDKEKYQELIESGKHFHIPSPRKRI